VPECVTTDLASYLNPPELAKLFEIEKSIQSIVQKTVKPNKDIPEAFD
jgi:hypothetical protein